MSERPERELTYLEWAYQWWHWAWGDDAKITSGTPSASESGDSPAPPHAESLELGVNERFRTAIELVAQRTGVDPAAMAAIINAEAGPVKDKGRKAALVEEAFRFRHPDRDWEARPLNATDPADAELMKEYKALAKSTAWDEKSVNGDTHATGLTQFISSTWELEAQRKGTYLNEVAEKKGLLDIHGNIVKGREQELLDLRKDPTLSIVAAAEYDRSVLEAVSRQKTSDPAAADRALQSRHPERDFDERPLNPKNPGDKTLIEEWKAIDAANGTPLIRPGLTDDEKAKMLYLCHHEGEAGAIRMLNRTLTDAQAHTPFIKNVTDPAIRAQLVAEHGSEAAAYKAWLMAYIDKAIVPENFRK